MKTLIAKFVGTNAEFRESLGLVRRLQVKHISMEECKKCEGEGYIQVPNGPDDFDQEECDVCHAAGYVERMPF